MPTSATMRAMVLERFGSPLTPSRIPRPAATEGHVLVRVYASGVNPLDVKIHAGSAAHAQTVLPAVLGIDMAGTVEAVGPGVVGFAAGDDVYGMTGGVGALQGSLAEYVSADARLLAKKPSVLTMREAAALPLACITAWEGLVDRAQLASTHSVLVHGGAGGVGSVCVQLARAIGATTYATGTAAQSALIANYGATPIDYAASSVDDYVAAYSGGRGFDVVYDTVGGSVLDASFTAVRTYGGHVISCLGWGIHSLAPLSFRAATYSGVFTLLPMLTGNGRSHHGEILRRCAQLAERGLIKPRIDPAEFSLEEANDAHALLEAGGTEGRVVITVVS